MVLGATLALGSAVTAGCGNGPGRGDMGADAAADGGLDGGRDLGDDAMVVDPVPPDMGFDVAQDLGEDAMVVDPVPPDMGFDMSKDMMDDVMVVDPPPPDMGFDMTSDSPQASLTPKRDDFGQPLEQDGADVDELNDLFHWTDSSPRRAQRTSDLPLFAPPAARLEAKRDGEQIRVSLKNLGEPASTRWEAGGEVSGEGGDRTWTSVTWTPSSETDMLRVAVRTEGGVSVLELRVRDVERPARGHLLV
jgi:hypothetical protein